jgi:hypothetical protein
LIEVLHEAGLLASPPTKRLPLAEPAVFMAVRTLIDPNDAEDSKRVHALQDAIKIEQPGAAAS